MDNINIEELINLDCTDSDNLDILIESLSKIKPLRKVYKNTGEIPLEYIERVIMIIDKKYNFGIRSISPDCNASINHIIWRSTVLNYKTIDIMKQIYGCTIYEVAAKTALYMYYKIKEM